MQVMPTMLADAAEELMRVLIGAAVVAIFIISSILSSTRKKPRRQGGKSWEEILRDLAGGQPQRPAPPAPPPIPTRPSPAELRRPQPPPLPPVPQPQRPVPRPKSAGQPLRRRKTPRGPSTVSAPPPTQPLVLVEREPLLPPTAADVAATEIGSRASLPAQRSRVAPAGESIARRLSPQSLRQQYILVEILQKPLSLRDQ